MSLLPSNYIITSNFEEIDTIIYKLEKIFKITNGYIQLRFKEFNLEDLENNVLRPISLNFQNQNDLNRLLINCSNIHNLNKLLILIHEYKLGGIHLASKLILNPKLKELIHESIYQKFTFSASCHDLNEIINSNKLKLKFIVISPVKPSISCPSENVLGWNKFKQLVLKSQHPVYALGGLTKYDLQEAIENGAVGIAAINSFWNKYEFN